MASSYRENLLEQRAKELERQLRELRRNIRQVERQGAPLPAAEPRPATPPARPPAPARAPGTVTGAPARPLPAESAPAPEPVRANRPVPPGPAPAGANPTEAYEQRRKFASYLSSGSLIPPKPMRQERRVVRNKAIFMLVLVVFALSVLLSILLR